VPAPPPAGKIELNAFGGWAVNSDIYGSGGTLQILDTSSWGASVAFRTPYGGSKVELKWLYYDPEVRYSALGSVASSHVTTNYFLLGGEKGIRRDRIEPFFGGSLGAVLYSPQDITLGGTRYHLSDTWRMAFGLGGGLRVYVHPKLAIRLGAEMVFPVYFNSGGVYFGTGGAGIGVSGGVPTVTGNFTVGLTFIP
jgi:hypothetical protein